VQAALSATSCGTVTLQRMNCIHRGLHRRAARL
jgi:hypothetical protein